MTQLILVRGPSGAGKSTFVKDNLEDYLHFEADQFFETWDFDTAALIYAHTLCKGRVIEAMADDAQPQIVVANTFIQAWELDFYIQAASYFEYGVHIITLHTQYENIHGVPDDKVTSMRNRMISNKKLASHYHEYNHITYEDYHGENQKVD